MSHSDQFAVIPIKFNSRVPSGLCHELFVKLDESTANERPPKFRGRTLLVTNIPPWMGENEIRALFNFVDPEEITVKKEAGPPNGSNLKPEANAGYKIAFLVLRSRSEVSEVLTRKYKGEICVHQDRGTELVGMRKMVDTYIHKYRPREELEAVISEAISIHDRALDEKKKSAEKLQTPDNDGWITVTKYGKRPFVPRTEAVQARLLEKERVKDQRKKLPDFYTFQAKRSKLNELEELRRKFGEDKRKVALLKMKRKFNPF